MDETLRELQSEGSYPGGPPNKMLRIGIRPFADQWVGSEEGGVQEATHDRRQVRCNFRADDTNGFTTHDIRNVHEPGNDQSSPQTKIKEEGLHRANTDDVNLSLHFGFCGLFPLLLLLKKRSCICLHPLA